MPRKNNKKIEVKTYDHKGEKRKNIELILMNGKKILIIFLKARSLNGKKIGQLSN
ncbi:hypothetical protein ACFL1Y_01005 [Patescibacteria group bacterium]